MAEERTAGEIIAEALKILEAKVKTVEDISRLVRLEQELEERLNEEGTEGEAWELYETDRDWWCLRLWTRRN